MAVGTKNTEYWVVYVDCFLGTKKFYVDKGKKTLQKGEIRNVL